MQVTQYKKYSNNIARQYFFMQKVNNMQREVLRLKIYMFSQSTLLINMMKDSLQKGPAYHFCPTMVNLFSLFISMFWLRTVDLHQVMVLVFTCWMFNFMLFLLVLGTTALWLHYLQEYCWWCFVCTEKSSKEKYNSVCTSKRPLSFTTINSSGFFFFQLLTKKKVMWSGDQRKKPRKANHLSFLAPFCDKN